jgi:hypothetical protein
MAEFIGIEVQGERQVALRFEQFPQFAHDRILAALQDIEGRLEAAVRGAEPARTGRLQGETGGRVYDHGDRMAAVVGVRARSGDSNEAGKAAALEYGAHRAFEVRAHAMSLTHLWGRAIAPISVQVAGHTRRPNISERRYLRGPIDAIRGAALDQIRNAVAEAVAEASR